ncbi:SEL1-like repeat protein [Rhizobium jaguaris]|uniref:tetratricopeptide repeat protein n=1 Tax=Rhizobium jaguaris TaxID=1312183 RepID=UPI0013C4B688|nr:SEL1-like repeat protein [Rhizobium jaguaris]
MAAIPILDRLAPKIQPRHADRWIRQTVSTAGLAVYLCASIPAYAGPARDAYDKEDYAAALKYAQSSAPGGNVEGQRVLGLLYLEGKAVPKDYDQALLWSRKAAEQDDVTLAPECVKFLFHQGRRRRELCLGERAGTDFCNVLGQGHSFVSPLNLVLQWSLLAWLSMRRTSSSPVSIRTGRAAL